MCAGHINTFVQTKFSKPIFSRVSAVLFSTILKEKKIGIILAVVHQNLVNYYWQLLAT